MKFEVTITSKEYYGKSFCSERQNMFIDSNFLDIFRVEIEEVYRPTPAEKERIKDLQDKCEVIVDRTKHYFGEVTETGYKKVIDFLNNECGLSAYTAKTQKIDVDPIIGCRIHGFNVYCPQEEQNRETFISIDAVIE